MTLTLAQAEDLAARTLAAIDAEDSRDAMSDWFDADRERVASDLAGLRECWQWSNRNWTGDEPHPSHRHHAARYADGLRRTARLYGVTA